MTEKDLQIWFSRISPTFRASLPRALNHRQQFELLDFYTSNVDRAFHLSFEAKGLSHDWPE